MPPDPREHPVEERVALTLEEAGALLKVGTYPPEKQNRDVLLAALRKCAEALDA